MINIHKPQLRKMPLYIGLAIIVFASLQQTIAYAIDVDFYSRNDILYYDPTSCTVTNQSGDIAIVGNDNAEKIFKFLISTKFSGFGDKPFNAIQAAGALGNFFQESGMDPGAIEGNGEGHGLAQWSYDRKATLFALASSQGKEWSDITVQLQMIQNELNGSYGASLLAQGFNDVKTPKDASYLFQVVYESAGVPNQANRDSAAESYYTKYQSLAPGDVTINGASTTTCDTSGGTSSGGLTFFMGSDFTIFNQCDYPPYGGSWGGMLFNSGATSGCMGGCGPTALAMVIKNMTSNNITPLDTMKYYDTAGLWIGQGSGLEGLQQGAVHWGLKTQSFDTKDINAYKDIFSKGGLVIVAGQGAAPFMLSTPHYIVIRGLTSDGKFLIGDPGQAESTNGTPSDPVKWDPTPIMMNTIPELSAAITK